MNTESKKIIRDIVPKKELTSLSSSPSKNKLVPRSFSERREEKKILSAIKSSVKKPEIFTAKKTKQSSFNNKFFKTCLPAGRWAVIIVPIFLALIATIYLLTPAGAAIIKIVPDSKIVQANIFIKAGEKNGDIKLSFVKTTGEKEGQVAGNGSEFIQKKASGLIMIYNGFSSNSQTLVRSTRFETANGKIYRIENTITVPGMKKQNGKVTAGSVEARIVADKAGKEYNLEFSDFTLPGFKSSPKYAKIYARSKSVISGGFAGNMPKISEKDLNDSRQKLEEELKTELWNKLLSQTPDEFIFIKEGGELKYSYENLASGETANILKIKEKAELTGALINKNDLVYFLAKKYLKNNGFEKNIYLKDLNDIKFTVFKKDAEAKEIIFKAEGETKIIKMIDEQKLKNELATAKNKNVVFMSHPEIIKADIKLKPFLKSRFPKNPSKIKIDIEI